MATRNPAHSAGTQRCVAVDLGPRYVRVVEVEQTGNEARIVRRGMAALPPNVWNDTGANRETLSSAIRQALAEAGIAAKTVVACLPRRLVTVRFARLPHAPPDQIRGMIELDAQQYILFPLNEVMLDYHIQSGLEAGLGSKDDMQTVLLAAARRSLVTDVVAVFDQAGLELSQLSVSALALAEHARDSLDPTALIALEPGSLDVCVVADGQLLYTRSSVLDLTGIDPEVAARKFGEEVARSFTAYQNEFRQKPLSHVYICGGEMAREGGNWMERVLTDSLEMPVSRLHSRLIPSSDPDGPTYAIAAGLALEGLGSNLAGVNLVPNERAERRVQQQKRIRQWFIGVAATAVVAAGAFMFSQALANQEKRLKETKAANLEMEDAQKREKPIKTRHDRVTAMDHVLTKELDRAHPSVDILVALNRSLPRSSEIWLTQLNFDRSSVMTLRGESKSPTAVTELLMNLQSSGAFTDVKLGLLADAQDNTVSNSDAAPKVAATTPEVAPLPGLPVNGSQATPGAAPGSPPMQQGGFPGYRNMSMPPGGGYGGQTPRTFGGNPGFPSGGPGGTTPGGFPNGGAPGTGGFPNGGPSQGGFPGGAQPTTPGGIPLPASPVPAPGGAPPINLGGGSTGGQAPQGGQGGSRTIVITPDMAGGNGVPGSPGGVSPGDANGQGFGGRRRRQGNGVTYTPGMSSIPVTQPVQGAAPFGTAPAPGAALPGGTVSPKAPVIIKRPRTTAIAKAPKAVLTSFVITCRLKPNAILLRPETKETVQSRPTVDHERPVVKTTGASTDTDTSDDTGEFNE